MRLSKLPRFAALLLFPLCLVAAVSAPVPLGSQRELFVDDHLIAELKATVLRPHLPEAREVVLVCDSPWEGNTSAYFSLFQDGDVYRCYYRGSHFDEAQKKGSHKETTCYAESRDGIVWVKPKLGLIEFGGSKQNNIVLLGDGAHNFSPFKDENPNCPPESRYKALARARDGDENKKQALQAYCSPDGVRWKLLREEPVITAGKFDSQNIAFYDGTLGVYRAYWRYFQSGGTDAKGKKLGGVRAIRMATSTDFVNWGTPVDLAYGTAPLEHLYTNAVRPYERAPQLLIGFPTRFEPKHQQVEPIFMVSRDGVNFQRWQEALIPITAPKDRDGNRSNYMAHGLLRLPGRNNEMSVYATEAYYKGPASRLRRFVFRLDGFVSASAERGEVITKPLTFSGTALSLNIVSKGVTRVELQDSDGKVLPGFSLEECAPITADSVDFLVSWKGGSLGRFAGKPVRLRIVLEKADLYSLQFVR